MHTARLPIDLDAPSTLTADERAIASSVLYAGLFDYPLTLAQLRQTLIGRLLTATEIRTLFDRSPALQAAIGGRDGFYFPAGRDVLIGERRRREARSRHFLRRHQVLLTLVCALPYVRMVALSGSIAHMNLEGSGDLDLFIVTRPGHVWSTAVLTVVFAKLLRRRTTVCANYVIADSELTFPDQDLFSASQILHLKPLVGFDVFLRLLADNPFVQNFYPNFHPVVGRRERQRRSPGAMKRIAERILAGPSWLFERLCRRAYGAYLKGKRPMWRSPEQVRLEDNCLKLHTQSHRHSVMQRFSDATGSLDASQ